MISNYIIKNLEFEDLQSDLLTFTNIQYMQYS
jgi:hypothetical protein